MDKSQLVTIAVTAIITAFVKEVAGWLFSIIKNFARSTTFKTKIKAALTVNKITAILNLGLIFFSASNVYYYVLLPPPVTPFTVFNIAYFTCAAFANMLRLEMQLAFYTEITQRDRVQRQLIEREIADRNFAELKPLDDAIRKLEDKLRASDPVVEEYRKRNQLPPKT